RALRWYHWLSAAIVLIMLVPLFAKPWHDIMAGYADRHFTLSERLLTELRIVVFYISLLVLPLPGRMNLDHDFSVSTSLLSPVSTLLSLLILVGILGLGVRLLKRQPLFSFGIFWFFLNLTVESSVIPLELIFEHRLYLPSVGFFVALMAMLDRLLSHFPLKGNLEFNKIVFLCFVIIASLLSLLTTLRNNDWRDAETIYGDSYEKSPLKPRANSNYALALGRSGKYDDAIKRAEKAIALGRENYEEYINAGSNILVCLMGLGKEKEAIVHGEKLLKEMPSLVNAGGYTKLRSNMGVAYHQTGKYGEALKNYIAALEREPATDYVYKNIARLFLETKEDKEAQKELELSGKEDEIFQRMASIALAFRQYDRAKTYIDMAFEIDSVNEATNRLQEKYAEFIRQNVAQTEKSNIKNNLTYKNNMYFRLVMGISDIISNYYSPLAGDPVRWLLGRAEKIDPDNPFVQLYLTRWYLKNNYIDKAVLVIESFIANSNNEDFVPLLEIAAECYLKQGQKEQAVIVYRHILSLYHGHNSWQRFVSVV
ncbi:hypothetical protein KKB18_13460, partial [bacterium]|nr:hypothetical protein [bacterium]